LPAFLFLKIARTAIHVKKNKEKSEQTFYVSHLVELVAIKKNLID